MTSKVGIGQQFRTSLFIKVAFDESLSAYPGALGVRKAADLDREQRAAEARAVYALEQHLEEFIDRYSASYGNYLGADEAKELFPEYAQSYKSRKRLVHSVHNASGALVKAIWERALATKPDARSEFVLFTAGGPGAGKTTAINTVPSTKVMSVKAFIVHDTMFAELDRADCKIQEVLRSGRRAAVVYVHRPIEKAMIGVVERARQTGRTVTLHSVAEKHHECQQTLTLLNERYAAEKRVKVIVLDNSGGVGEAKRIPLSKWRTLLRDRQGTRRRAAEALDDAYVRRIDTAEEITASLYISIRDKGIDY